MATSMDWNKLFSARRLGATAAAAEPADIRSEFVRDYDRLIFSSSFRRLQDKTQVFPLAKSDYVRTRLTHSLEVASVGRSLGYLAGQAIHNEDSSTKHLIDPHDIGVIVSTACLAHDIGNPPFGHAGESAIQEWFSADDQGGRFRARWKLLRKQEQDFLKFEGNAQGFRTIANTQTPEQRGGMRLTHAVLACFTKYPRESSVDVSQMNGISGKKFGFMQAERTLFEEVATDVGLVSKPGQDLAWHRHPLSFLVEAADDICYHVMDIEDGFRTGALSFDELHELHAPWRDGKIDERAGAIQDKQRQAEYYRAKTIGKLIQEVVLTFRNNLTGIMSGSFDEELSAHIEHKNEFKRFKEIARTKVYNSKPVVEIEACGFEVISGLLSAFVMAMDDFSVNGRQCNVRSRTLLRLMPINVDEISEWDAYTLAAHTTDFISGMTDSYAVSLYQRIRGISLP
ncbi:deoxyguanosinetriphosphate triphosphohydrolase [Burkholderia contaminans]|uniref:deoxyguanosinetriphosphate triphosphohydrolase n=1 Tax=Burkholderia contaminans TaxID=488447 RepID=UPI000F57B88E|nr:deoxyguanosinetriphosphate triphosphohydrolase [Burkholderia contaminans]RQT24080.1 deoxyguanosinetriphosphate triphosphohydrolase [Burkholderia contaminans]